MGVCALLLGTRIAAIAQGSLPPPNEQLGPCADQDAHFAARITFLQIKLALKPEQNSDWDAFVAAAWAAEKPLQDLCRNLSEVPSMHEPMVRLEAWDRATQGLSDHQRDMREAIARLKQALDPDQRRRFAQALLATSNVGGFPPGPLGRPMLFAPFQPSWRP